jgi:phosphoribosylpyrophosphate synthetase
VLRFSEGNLFVRVQENVRGRRVYLVQSTVFPANDHFMELLFWIDALKRASAESVTDSIETQPVALSRKVEVVSVAPLFGEAIRRIHNRESISVLFPA